MLFPMLQLTTTLLFISGGRLAASMQTTSTGDLERRIDPDNVFMYSVDYFIKIAVNKPQTGTCLFYTQGLTQRAQEFALEQNLFTIWDIWDPAFYNRSQAVTNPLREILKFSSSGLNPPDAQIYFTNMSKAYAMLCDLYAVVMTRDPKNVIESGIWGQVEKPTLQQTGNPGGQVDLIDACNVNGTNIAEPSYWSRSANTRRDKIVVVPILLTAAACLEPMISPYSSTLFPTTFTTAPSSFSHSWSNSTGAVPSSTTVRPKPVWSNATPTHSIPTVVSPTLVWPDVTRTSYISSSAASSPAYSSSLMSDVRRRQKFPLAVLPHSIYTPQELGSMFSDIDALW